jgi:hypothetical protein
MSEYIEPMFAVPIFHLYAEDWDSKKKLLQSLSSHQEFKKEEGEYVASDFRSKKVEWTKIELVIRNELEKFKKEVNLPLEVDAYWFEKGGRGDQHLIHNHGAIGFSAVMYIDYDPEEHTPTQFVCPFNNVIGWVDVYSPRDIRSGSVIFFPSFVGHYTLPCESEKERLVLSWNMK